ncbi:MAG: hypothetical protein ABJD97_02205 [Betaproteobacteria bacterium]
MLVQVCPPGTGGVRDYADCLRHAWAVRAIASELIEGREATAGETPLAARLDALAAVARDGRLTVILHFSGYGYAGRGLCQWLVDELRAAKARHGASLRLMVVFHELFATGMPWRSAFWLAPRQSSIARRLAALADSLWTNTDHHARWLRSAAGAAVPLQVRPVFSNVGEPVDPPSWGSRQPHAIVFGSAGTRRRALVSLRGREPALLRLGVTEIVEVGDGDSQCAQGLGVATRQLGRLSPQALGALLCTARFGLLNYPARHLGKSGVFAAYAAHACVALNTFALDADADGLRAGAHYVDLRACAQLEDDALAQMSKRLTRWYGGHSLALQSGELLHAAASVRAAPAAMARASR